MTFIVEVTNNLKIKVTKKTDKNTYIDILDLHSNLPIDDFFIDQNCKVYTVNNKNIYFFDKHYILLATNVIYYKFINTENGCTLYYTQKKEGSNSYMLVERRIEKQIYEEKTISLLDQLFNICVDTDQRIVMYDKNILLLIENGITTKKEMSFEILKIKLMNNVAVILDNLYNLQMYNLETKQIEMGFKSLGNTINFTLYSLKKYIAVLTNNYIFVIALETRSILTQIDVNEIINGKITFTDANTLILYDDEVFEYHINNGDINCKKNTDILKSNVKKIKDRKENVRYKIIHNLKPENRNISENIDKCNCHQTILNMKIEMRRGLFVISEKIRQIEEAVAEIKK